MIVRTSSIEVIYIDGSIIVMMAPHKDISEVMNVYEFYERLDGLEPYSVDDLLTAHGIMTRKLEDESGMFRSRPVGVVDQEGVSFSLEHCRSMS